MFRPPIYKLTNSSFISNNLCAEHEQKLNIELVNKLCQLKSHPQHKIKGKDKGKRCKHKDNTRCVIEEETEALGVKPLRRPPSDQ